MWPLQKYSNGVLVPFGEAFYEKNCPNVKLATEMACTFALLIYIVSAPSFVILEELASHEIAIM